MSDREVDLRGTLALLGNVLIWSVTPVLLKVLTHDIDAWTANALRYPFAAILFWPTLVRHRMRGALDLALLRRAIVPAFFAGAGQVFWALSPYYVDASDLGFLAKFALVWAFIGSVVLFPEERRLLSSRRFWFGIVLAVAGFVALAVERGVLAQRLSGQGVAIVAACSFFFGLYGVSVRRFLRGVSPLLSFAVVSQYVAAGTLVLAIPFGDFGVLGELSSSAWLWLAVTALLGISISHVLFYVAVLRLGAALTNSVHLLGPFLTCAVASQVLDERLGPRAWVAGVVLLVGGGFLLRAQESVTSEKRVLPGRPSVDAARGEP